MPATYHNRFLSPMERFCRNFNCDQSGCWLWTAGTDNQDKGHLPYAKFWMHGRTIQGHRAAWLIFRSDIPKGLKVLHKCDVPQCVNPSHLYLGTSKDNTRDMIVKNRHQGMLVSRRGEKSNFAKLKASQVVKIRKDKRTYRIIALQYGISTAAVCLIKQKKNWKHI